MPRAALPSIKLESFEGPFDLLLELARKQKVDLSRVSLRTITDDFLAYLAQDTLPVATQGDFLVVAATLMLIKIRQLLPSLTKEEEEEITSLTDRIRLYQLYRQQAPILMKRWGKAPLFPAHFWAGSVAPASLGLPIYYPDMQLNDLRAALQSIIKELPKPIRPRAHLTVRGRTLQEWLKLFSRRLSRAKELIFQETVQGTSKQDAAVSFLALLEMARNQQITLSQDSTSRLRITRSL